MQFSRAFAFALAVAVVVPVAAVAADLPQAGLQDKKLKHRLGKLSPEQRGELRARVQDKLSTYLVVELSQRAGLDDKKSVQLGTAVKAHLARMEAAREAKHKARDTLKQLVDSKANDAALQAQIKAVLGTASRDEQQDLFIADIGKFLSATEQAKIVVALPEVMKDAMRLVREARRGKGDTVDE